jgi:hypothetical protein
MMIVAAASAVTAGICGSISPLTSLMMLAPAASARAATAALLLSTEIGARSAMARIVGRIRRHSSSASTTGAPGRVDSPPTSIQSAPASTIAWAAVIAAPGRSRRVAASGRRPD